MRMELILCTYRYIYSILCVEWKQWICTYSLWTAYNLHRGTSIFFPDTMHYSYNILTSRFKPRYSQIYINTHTYSPFPPFPPSVSDRRNPSRCIWHRLRLTPAAGWSIWSSFLRKLGRSLVKYVYACIYLQHSLIYLFVYLFISWLIYLLYMHQSLVTSISCKNRVVCYGWWNGDTPHGWFIVVDWADQFQRKSAILFPLGPS